MNQVHDWNYLIKLWIKDFTYATSADWKTADNETDFNQRYTLIENYLLEGIAKYQQVHRSFVAMKKSSNQDIKRGRKFHKEYTDAVISIYAKLPENKIPLDPNWKKMLSLNSNSIRALLYTDKNPSITETLRKPKIEAWERLAIPNKEFQFENFFHPTKFHPPTIPVEDQFNFLRFDFIKFILLGLQTHTGYEITNYFRLSFRVYSRLRQRYIRVRRKSFVLAQSGVLPVFAEHYDVSFKTPDSIHLDADFGFKMDTNVHKDVDPIQIQNTDRARLIQMGELMNSLIYLLNMSILDKQYQAIRIKGKKPFSPQLFAWVCSTYLDSEAVHKAEHFLVCSMIKDHIRNNSVIAGDFPLSKDDLSEMKANLERLKEGKWKDVVGKKNFARIKSYLRAAISLLVLDFIESGYEGQARNMASGANQEKSDELLLSNSELDFWLRNLCCYPMPKFLTWSNLYQTTSDDGILNHLTSELAQRKSGSWPHSKIFEVELSMFDSVDGLFST